MLPAVSEIAFLNQNPDYWPIVTYDAKWKPGIARLRGDAGPLPGDGIAPAQRAAAAGGKQAFRLLGCRDYARSISRPSHGQAVYP